MSFLKILLKLDEYYMVSVNTKTLFNIWNVYANCLQTIMEASVKKLKCTRQMSVHLSPYST